MANPLEQYVQRVRAILATEPSKTDLVTSISEVAAELVAAPLELTDEQRSHPDGGYGRNLLYKDADDGWVVIAMVWPPGFDGPAHDHGVWGVVAVSEGRVRVTNYSRTDDGAERGRCRLEPCDCIEGGPGATATVLPPECDWHAVGNALDDRVSISIHTYGADLRRCRAADLESGEMRTVEMSYGHGVHAAG